MRVPSTSNMAMRSGERLSVGSMLAVVKGINLKANELQTMKLKC